MELTTTPPITSQKVPIPPIKKSKKPLVIATSSVLLIIITLIGIFLFIFAFIPGQKIYSQIETTKKEVNDLKAAAYDKDLDQVKIRLDVLKNRVGSIDNDYKRLALIGSLPFINDYYQDGKRLIDATKEGLEAGGIVVQAVEPYKDFLGIKGSATDSAKTTEDRIAFLTESVEGLTPHLDTIEKKIDNIENLIDQVDPNRYPEEFRGYEIRSNIFKAKDILAETHKLVKDGKPILTKTSWFLGKDSPRQYFLLFQNDAELRPTGGFWTAYGILKVDNGKITPVISDDIYTLDNKFNSTIPAPRPLKTYHINVPYFNLRDMNISPDFPTSVELFLQNYQKVTKNQQIDAVIAIDTQVLVDLVKVLGRVGVSGFGNFSSDPDKRCDGCPQIIYQLEWLAGRPRNYIEKDRKGFLGPLMHSLLTNAMGSEKEKIGPLVQGMLNNVYQKHILFYFLDKDIQEAANLANITGKINKTDKTIDYIHINDANMSSAKTNLFLKQKIKHEIISKDGKVEHKIAVSYTNPSKASNCNLEKGDLCLNAPKYRNWFRFYTNPGSQLIKMTGSEVEPVVYEELDKQVFEGFYGDKYPLYAQSSIKTSIQYVSSVPASPNYVLFLQKQPGTKPIIYELIVNGKKQEAFEWVADKTLKLPL